MTSSACGNPLVRPMSPRAEVTAAGRVERQVGRGSAQPEVVLLELLQPRHPGGQQVAVDLALSVIILVGDPRLTADLLDCCALLGPLQDQGDLLLVVEPDPLHRRSPRSALQSLIETPHFGRFNAAWQATAPSSGSSETVGGSSAAALLKLLVPTPRCSPWGRGDPDHPAIRFSVPGAGRTIRPGRKLPPASSPAHFLPGAGWTARHR